MFPLPATYRAAFDSYFREARAAEAGCEYPFPFPFTLAVQPDPEEEGEEEGGGGRGQGGGGEQQQRAGLGVSAAVATGPAGSAKVRPAAAPPTAQRVVGSDGALE
jgi:hypothetical protein